MDNRIVTEESQQLCAMFNILTTEYADNTEDSARLPKGADN